MSYALSGSAQTAVAGSHAATARLEVLQAGRVVASIGPAANGRAGIVDGSVTQDRTASVRTRTTNLVLADPDGLITPRAASDPLQPYGQEIRPYRGIVLPSGQVEWVPLGTLPIVTATRTDDGTYSITIEAQDRAYVISRRRSTTGSYTIPAGTGAVAAITSILTSRYPGLTVLPPSVDYPLPALAYDETADLWSDAATQLAQAIGCELYFDRLGQAVIAPTRDPGTDPVTCTLAEAANLMSVSAASTGSDTYSRTIVTGETTDGSAPVRATSVDADPSSPTYYLGPFGDVPQFLQSPLITTQGQAQVVADALLRQVKGLSEQVNVTALPDPSVDAGDVAYVRRIRAAVDAKYVLETVELPLTADGTLQVTARRRSS